MTFFQQFTPVSKAAVLAVPPPELQGHQRPLRGQDAGTAGARPAFAQERELLLLVARPTLGPAERSRLAALAEVVDWDTLLQAARFHLLKPALWREVASLTAIPEGLRMQLRLANVESSARNMRLVAATTQLHAQLEGAGIGSIFFKGPILAQEAYGGASGRGFSDVDLLVRRSDVVRVIDKLQETGFRPLFPLDGRWMGRYLGRFYELSFRDPGGVLIDLHWSLIDPQFSFCPRESDVWRDLRTVEINGRLLETLSVDMTARYLCLHVAKHHWDRIGWLSDVAHWMVRNPEIDWARLGREPAAGRFVLITLGLIQRLLGESLTPDVTALIDRDDIVRQQIDSVDARLLRGPGQSITRSAHWRTEFARAMPRPSDRGRSFYTTLFRPSVKEWRAVPLPEVLSPLYAIIRPCRLLWKRVLRSAADQD